MRAVDALIDPLLVEDERSTMGICYAWEREDNETDYPDVNAFCDTVTSFIVEHGSSGDGEIQLGDADVLYWMFQSLDKHETDQMDHAPHVRDALRDNVPDWTES